MRERGTRRKWRGAGSHLSLPRKPARFSVQITRHLNAASHHHMLRRVLAPNLRGGDAGPCPWAPSPWLQGREPVRTCCPGAAQGRSTSHHLPSDGRMGTRASAACSPSIRLRAGIPSAGDLTLGAWTRCADAGGGEGQGPFQMNGKSSRRERGQPKSGGAGGVGAMSAARPPMPWEDSGHSGNALAQQAGGLGGDLLAGSSCPSTAGAPWHSCVQSLDVKAPQIPSWDHSLPGVVPCRTAPSWPRGGLCPVPPRCVCTGEREPPS